MSSHYSNLASIPPMTRSQDTHTWTHLSILTSKSLRICSGFQTKLKHLMESDFLMPISGRPKMLTSKCGGCFCHWLGFLVTHAQGCIIADPIFNTKKQFNVFFNEALTILAALKWAAMLNPPPQHLAIHTDSMTSFSIFNSLWAISTYNLIILQSVKVWLKSKIDLWVFHIDGKKNVVADALHTN